jgi:hypothetical protein
MRRLVLGAVLFSVGAASVAALTAWRQPFTELDHPEAIALPVRNAPDPPPIPQPPVVPTHARALPSGTFVLTTTRSDARGKRTSKQTITRTHDRIHLAIDGGREEWLFVQNAVYRDRVSGYLIDHSARHIRLYEESALRSLMQIRGWADVLTVRFDPATLAALRDTRERRQAGGSTFARFVATESTGDGVVEVWWSEALLLPLSVTVREDGTTVTSVVEHMTSEAEASLLTDPARRFPQYESRDAADAPDH